MKILKCAGLRATAQQYVPLPSDAEIIGVMFSDMDGPRLAYLCNQDQIGIMQISFYIVRYGEFVQDGSKYIGSFSTGPVDYYVFRGQ